MATPGFCSRCGSKLSSGSYFCSKCGITLNAPPATTQTQSLLNPESIPLLSEVEYVIDKRIPAIRDTFAVKNRVGELLGYVKKKMVRMGPQFWFEDLNGQQLGEVHGKTLATHHTYEVLNSIGNRLGVVKKKVRKLLGTEWWLEAPPGTEIAKVQGNIMNHDYLMLNPLQRRIAQVHKKWVSLPDSFCIEFLDRSFDRMLILGFVVAIESDESEARQVA